MRNQKGSATLIVLGVVALAGLVSWVVAGPDNKIEEASEQIIYDQTGVDIDISMGTPEEHPIKQR